MRSHLKFLSSIIFAVTFLVGGFFISNTALADGIYSTYKITIPEITGTVVAGDSTGTTVPVTLSADTINDIGYSNVRVNVAVSTTSGGTAQLLATDTQGQQYDVVQVGYWGPTDGFPISYNYSISTSFTGKFSAAGDYTITTTLVDMSNPQSSLATTTKTITVVAPETLPTLGLSGVPSTVTTESRAAEDSNGIVTGFSTTNRTSILVSLTKGNRDYSNVRVTVTAAQGSASLSGIQLLAMDTNNTWYNIVDTGWGTPAGFNLANATTPAYIVANTAGTYNININLVNVANNNTVLASTTASVTASTEQGGGPNYTAIFTEIKNALFSKGINTNILDCTNTPTACIGLSFEKVGKGKITFNDNTHPLDLTDSATQTYLSNLGNNLDMATAGKISLDAVGSALAGVNANIKFYGTDALGIPDNASPSLIASYIVVKNGNMIIPSTDPNYPGISEFQYVGACEVNETVCHYFSFNVGHFTTFELDVPSLTDNTAPVGGTLTMITNLHPTPGIIVTSPTNNNIYTLPDLSMDGADVFNSLTVVVTDDTAMNTANVPVYVDTIENGYMTYKGNNLWNYEGQTATLPDFRTGTHNLVATFKDLANNSTTLTATFTTDNLGPTAGQLTMVTQLHSTGITVTSPTAGVYTITTPLSFNGVDVFQALSVVAEDTNLNTSNVSVSINGVANGEMVYDSTNHIWNYANQNGAPAFTDRVQTITATFSDLAGNTTPLTLNFTTDATSPTAVVAYSTTTPTNGSVTATITPSETVVGDLTYTFTENGTHTFNFTDLAGNTGSTMASITNIDKVTPTLTPITIASSNTHSNLAKNGDEITVSFTASEELKNVTAKIAGKDAVITNDGLKYYAKHTIVEGDSSDKTVKFVINYTDLAGNAGIQIVSATDGSNVIYDELPPVIADHAAIRPIEATSGAGALVTYTSPVTTDAVDVSGIATCTPASDTMFNIGWTDVNCSATDTAGNTSTSKFGVEVLDTTKPVITRTGDATVTLTAGDSYTDAGATASDIVDGNITGRIATVNPVDTSKVGTYTVTYNVSDNAGNAAAEVTRTVTVKMNPAQTETKLDTTTENDLTTGTIPTETNLTVTSNDISAEVNIPAGTVVAGPAGWDGTINSPTVVTTTVNPTPANGTSVSDISSIELGFGNTHLTFNNPVSITFAGKAGSLVGWSQNGTFHNITNTCNSATNPTLAADSDCKINVGNDLVVWTRHFTTFTSYTQRSNSSSGSSPSGRSTTVAANTAPQGQVLGASTEVGQVLGAEKFNFTKLMKKGSKGNEVMELQKFLNAAGYNCGTADGKFGPKTLAALAKWQIVNGLKGDGIAGPKTRAILNK